MKWSKLLGVGAYLSLAWASCEGGDKVSSEKAKPSVRRMLSAIADESAEAQSPLGKGNSFRVAPVLGFDYLFLTASSIDGWNSGTGYFLGARADIPVSSRMRVSPSLLFISWKVSREIPASSTAVSKFAQTLGYLGVGATGGYALIDGGDVVEHMFQARLWLESGLEYLLALSATQSENGGQAVSFSNSSRPLLFSLGARVDVEFSSRFSGEIASLVYYNVASQGGSHLVGLRLNVGASYSF